MATKLTDSSNHIVFPSVGHPAANLALPNTEGEPTELVSLWREKPLIIVFLRHYGCTFCREQVLILKRDYDAIVKSGASVVCVAMGPYKAAKGFKIVMELPFDILSTGDDVDPFRAYGLGRASAKDMLNPVVWWRVTLNTLRGIFNNPMKAQGDMGQLSGCFVVGTDGNFTFVSPGKRVDHVIDPKMLLASVKNK
ncbi:MAG TPA: peroxiredoxin-like family protein [Capsulimonadaceae bacterium]|jgi:peroxiredoxin